jgi:DNA-binding HxlR family transcriptional regulator
VEYDLTPLGHELLGQVDRLMDWIRGRNPEIRRAREAFDAAEE